MVAILVDWWKSSRSFEGSLAVSEASESALPRCCNDARGELRERNVNKELREKRQGMNVPVVETTAANKRLLAGSRWKTTVKPDSKGQGQLRLGQRALAKAR